MKYQGILLFGAPGTGKGTQGKIIGQIPGFLHSSTGELFRSLDPHSELGQMFADYATKGLLVPDEFTIRLWKRHMGRLVATGKFDPIRHLVLMDGIPRDVNQAKLLADVVDVRKIIYLDTACQDSMVARLKSRALKEGRTDDADENVIRKRMMVYHKETEPVLECYPPEVVSRVEANQSIIRVFSEVLQALVPVKEAMEHEGG